MGYEPLLEPGASPAASSAGALFGIAKGDAGMAVDVLIVGAGVSGLCMAARLQTAGFGSFLILEKASELGGTWRDNNYPGCACDIPSHLYSYSFEPNPSWSKMFAPQAEILAYLQRMASARALDSKIRFGCEVKSMHWDDAATKWSVRTIAGERYAARFVISALGALHHPAQPEIPGIGNFRGERFHSAIWNHRYDLAGKRVAVVGTGASSIQFVPQIVGKVARLHLFQRTPPWILPKVNPVFDTRQQWRFRYLPLYRRWLRSRLFFLHEQRVGGFTGDPALMGKIERFARQHLARQVTDSVLRARLTPDYAIGCKRLLISSDWYPALQRPNLEVVSESLREVRAGAVVTADGVEREVDALIFGTGFDTQNNLSRLDVRGRHGVSLAQRWADGAGAYLGTLVAGFPNLFVMLGPNSGLAHNSQIFMIEAQARYVMSCLNRMRRRTQASLEVRDDVQASFNRELADRLGRTVWQVGHCHNWYQDAAGRNTINWPGTSLEYWWRTARARAADFRGNPRRAGETGT